MHVTFGDLCCSTTCAYNVSAHRALRTKVQIRLRVRDYVFSLSANYSVYEPIFINSRSQLVFVAGQDSFVARSPRRKSDLSREYDGLS